jgi:uncharacterized membrane protein YfcA
MDPFIIVFGLAVGLLVGMTGVGGGSLMTPLLIIVFGVKPVTAIGTDLAYAAVTKTVGGYKHFTQGTVDLPLSTLMAVLAGAILFTGVVTLARALFFKHLADSEREELTLERRHKMAAVLIGIFVGFMLGVTSAGSGALIALALILAFRLVPRRVVGTDVFHAAILLWAAAVAHVVAGNVDFALAGNILIGSVPGVWFGSQWSVRIPPGTLRTVLGVVLIGAGLGLATKAGLDLPAPVLAAVPLVIAALALWPRIAQRRARRRGEAAAGAGASVPDSAEV